MLRDIIRDTLDSLFSHWRHPRARLHRLQRRRARLVSRAVARASKGRLTVRIEARIARLEQLIADTRQEIRALACSE